MKKQMGGIMSLVLVAVFSGMIFAADPFTPSNDDRITPAKKPLLSPEKGEALQKQTEKSPGLAPALLQNTGVISGTVEVFDTPREGCSSMQFQLQDNDLMVPASSLSLYRITTGNPLSTGHGYKISNLRPGVHVISMKTIGDCAGFQWTPDHHRVELVIPDRMESDRRNFVYKRDPARFIKPFKPIR